MVEKALVESEIAESAALIRALDTKNDAPTFAVWYFFDDADEWRLMLAGPTFDPLLPTKEHIAYRKVIDAMASASLSALSFASVKLVKTDDPLVQILRRLIRTGPTNIVHSRFVNTTLQNVFVSDMLILRSA
jgi:hypothetical protein